KSWAVISCPSDHTASGLMVYTTRCGLVLCSSASLITAESYTEESCGFTTKALGSTASRTRWSAQVFPRAEFGLQPVGAWSMPRVSDPPIPVTHGSQVVVVVVAPA